MNNKSQRDKIRSVLFAIQASSVPVKMRNLKIGYNLENAIKNSGLVVKQGGHVVWNKGKFITENIVDQIYQDSYELGVKYREELKKKEEQQFKLFAQSVNNQVGQITDVAEDSKGIQIEFEQTTKAEKRLKIAGLLRQIAEILEN